MPFTAYENRLKTDRFFELAPGKASFTGYAADSVQYIKEKSLTDPALWALFVEQFRIGTVDDHDLGWRCEYWGKMMRGACFTYACTQDKALYTVLETSARDMLTVQQVSGRISTYSPEAEFQGWDIWGRKYVLLGMQYFLEICPDADLQKMLIASMCAQVDYMMERLGEAPDKRPICATSTHWEGLNSASVLEPIVRLYNLTKDGKYLEFAREIIRSGGTRVFNIYEAALEGKLHPYEYPITKAYEMISNFEGILEYYRVTGEEKYRTMCENFAKLVIESDITVIGSAGTTHELFDHSIVRQFNPAFNGIMQETCVTVTWMKFCWQMLLLTGDPKYADQIEVSVYNALLGAINYEDHVCKNQVFPFDSYSPLLNGWRGRAVGGYKDILKNRFWWGCCVAIGAAGTGLIPLSACMKARDGLVCNLYLSGTASVTQDNGQEFSVTIDTNYPETDKIRMTVNTDATSALYLRIPAWSKNTVLTVNGEAVSAVSGTYARVERCWKVGDVVELTLDLRIRIVRAAEIDPEADEASVCHAALLRGPIALARDTRFGENVAEAVRLTDHDGFAAAKPASAPFACHQAWEIATENGAIQVADYASCGRDWDENLPISVWVTTK